jgi:hypothetical protein
MLAPPQRISRAQALNPPILGMPPEQPEEADHEPEALYEERREIEANTKRNQDKRRAQRIGR